MKHDIDVRELVLSELNKKYSNRHDTKVINEMGIAHGSSRIDIAVINGVLHGYELKSESDSLKRLSRQASYYEKIFERMTLVIDKKFLDKAKLIIPSWWGISVINDDYSKTISVRKGRKIKTKDYPMLLNLLWREELVELLDFLGYPKRYKKLRKDEIYEIVLKDKRKSTVKKYIYSALKNRDYS
ncbi:sce7726 family protein [Levilactobacillus brevis]|mgnify:CR=1 FL=1|uniref:sce7726 family protein n=1 Tax=Levilactobacillus brevis TaxID=1580 RepID=UPI001C123B6D|nr:sce7726 family protein [Levilactobacillus brevis]